MNQRTVVVHGASGAQGAPVARRLQREGWRVAGVARGPGGLPDHVVPVRADLGDPAALAAAYEGADAVVVQLPLEFDPAVIAAQVDHVVAAVRRAGVTRVVLNASSPLPPGEIGIPFVDGRVRLARELAASVPATTVVAPVFAYMENLAIPASARRLRERGELAYPVPAAFPMPWLAADDLAATVADLLAAPAPVPPGTTPGGVVPGVRLVAGPEALTGPAAAERVGGALGRPVTWVTIDHTEYEAMLRPHLGTEAAAGIAGFYASPPPGSAPPGPEPVRGPTTLAAWATSRLEGG